MAMAHDNDFQSSLINIITKSKNLVVLVAHCMYACRTTRKRPVKRAETLISLRSSH